MEQKDTKDTNGEQTSNSPSQTPEQIETEKVAREIELERRRLEIKQQAVNAMLEPHPISGYIHEAPNMDELYDKVITYLHSYKRAEEPGSNRKLDRSMWVKIWSVLLSEEKNMLRGQMVNSVDDSPGNTIKDQLRKRRSEIALTLFDAFAHNETPELPNLRTGIAHGPKEWTKPEFWGGHPDSANKLSKFIEETRNEVDALRLLVFKDLNEESFRGNTHLEIGREVLVDGVSPEETAGAILDNVNNVIVAVQLRNQFALRAFKPAE